MSDIKRLYCCVCGDQTHGRQWWNRDTGYGLCVKCADWLKNRETPEQMRSYYGERGVHYDVPASEAAQ